MQRTVSVASIKIGNRFRQKIKGIDKLAESIAETKTLLRPIAVTPDLVLVAGLRQLEAAKKLGWKKVPVRIVDVDPMLGQLADSCRDDPLPSEMFAIHEFIAKRTKRGPNSASPFKGRVSKQVGLIVNRGAKTIDRIVEIHKAAKKEPAKYAELTAAMDRHGSVMRVYTQFKRLTLDEYVKNAKPSGKVVNQTVEDFLPRQKPATWDAVFADPPWGVGLSYNGWREPKQTDEEYGEWIMALHAQIMPLVKRGGFLCWSVGRQRLKNVWNWFGDNIHLFASCLFLNPRKGIAVDLAVSWQPLVICWQGDYKARIKASPRGRRSCFDWFASDTGQYKNDPSHRHPCPKPVDCFQSILDALVPRQGRVLDLFAGSGSVSRAAFREGRDFLAVERDKDFCGLIAMLLEREKLAKATAAR